MGMGLGCGGRRLRAVRDPPRIMLRGQERLVRVIFRVRVGVTVRVRVRLGLGLGLRLGLGLGLGLGWG